jgi:ankyrin repeat protein
MRTRRIVGLLGVTLGVGLLGAGCHSAQHRSAQEGRTLSPSDALTVAAIQGNDAAVQKLLAAGGDPNAMSSEQQPVLIAAALNVRHSGDVVEDLLTHGARADTAADGISALTYALMNDNPSGAQSLLAHGAQADAEDKVGMTPLITAAMYGETSVVQALLRKGARVDHRDKTGSTALAYAAYRGQAQAVKVLLAAGADPALRDAKGRTALDKATERHYFGIVALLKSAPVGKNRGER